MKTVVKKFERCFICSRPNPHRPQVRYVIIRGDTAYDITSRPCGDTLNDRCPPFTEEERRNPEIRKHWVRLGDPEDIEPGIREIVLACNERGLETMWSCDGHGTKNGYIDFYEEAHCDQAIKLFLTLRPHKELRKTKILGEHYRMIIPRSNIVGAEPRKKRDAHS